MATTRSSPGSSGQDISIREMTIDDYDSVTAVWKKAQLEYRPRGRDRRDRIRREMERDTAVFLVARAGEEIVGVVLGTHDGRRAWINRLAVVPEYQHRGIARLLVSEVERRVEALGIDIVAALIESENAASLSFFKAIGYLHNSQIEYVSKRSSPDT